MFALECALIVKFGLLDESILHWRCCSYLCRREHGWFTDLSGVRCALVVVDGVRGRLGAVLLDRENGRVDFAVVAPHHGLLVGRRRSARARVAARNRAARPVELGHVEARLS